MADGFDGGVAVAVVGASIPPGDDAVRVMLMIASSE
jgi:hypothetical protein